MSFDKETAKSMNLRSMYVRTRWNCRQNKNRQDIQMKTTTVEKILFSVWRRFRQWEEKGSHIKNEVAASFLARLRKNAMQKGEDLVKLKLNKDRISP